MTHFKTVALFCKLLTALTVAIFSLGASAEPYFIHDNGAMVLDKATGLLWMRCSLGQKWDGITCAGEAKGFNFDETQQAATDFNASGGFNAHNDWRVPTVRELQTLRICSTGFKNEQTNVQDGGEQLSLGCNKNATIPTINHSIFTGIHYSSEINFSRSSSNKGTNGYAWVVYFSSKDSPGFVYERGNSAKGYVRLVRASQLLGDTVAPGFVPSVSALEREKELAPILRARQATSEKAEMERRATAEKAERDRIDAAERQERQRTEAARTAALKKLIAGGAQSLYLQAGKAQRSGSVDVNGVSFSADELYELIVEKFSSSDFAVKAADQLNAMDRSQRQASATRDAAAASERAANAQRDADRNSSGRAACFSQVRSCEARCSDSSNRGVCIQMCQRTCN